MNVPDGSQAPAQGKREPDRVLMDNPDETRRWYERYETDQRLKLKIASRAR
jgi:hypothetical protein